MTGVGSLCPAEPRGGSAPELGSQEGLRQGGTRAGPSRTFQDLVEAPKEYPPHFGQVEGGLLQGGAGVTAEVGQRLSAGWGAGQGARETPRRKAGGRTGVGPRWACKASEAVLHQWPLPSRSDRGPPLPSN